jgi:hypothetical protein
MFRKISWHLPFLQNTYIAESTGLTASPESTALEYKTSGNAEFSPKSHFKFIYRSLHEDVERIRLECRLYFCLFIVMGGMWIFEVVVSTLI